ncbi:MAG: HI0074 family nucleotidyltransferase substrate-binding subunit [Fusobacteriaceae bacterium]
MFGICEDDFFEIIEILKKYKEKIEWVKIFGSRARGDNKKTSDIDLAINFRDDSIFLNLIDEFYNSTLKYSVDVIQYKSNSSMKIIKNIDNDGVLIYKTNEKGDIIMTMNKLQDKLYDYKKAFSKLEIALEKDARSDELYLDGTIQRFEFVYELSWKLMKHYLEFEGIEASSPRTAFREAFKMGIISDAAEWIKLMENRNRTSHTYNEETAWDIYEKISTEYISIFDEFKNKISEKINNI